MSVRKIFTLLAAWLLVCAWVLEPALISPYFDGVSSIELVSADVLSGMSDAASTVSGAMSTPRELSMDHFRLICLLYFGVPAAAFLLFQEQE